MTIRNLLLFCFLIAATSACNSAKPVSVNAENATASKPEQPTPDNIESQTEKTFTESPASSAASLTGTYEYKGGNRANEIKVLQISEGVLKVSFLGNSEFESQAGPMANSGVISARKVQLENAKTALLTYEDAPDCMIFLTFKGNKIEVRQNENDCGFPGGVSADGVYKKTSAKPPVFDFDENPDDTLPEAILEKQPGDARGVGAPTRIRFNAGENSAIVKGKVSGGASTTYVIGARAGQTMTIKVIDGGTASDVVFDVVAPDGVRMGGDRMYDDWSRKLPKNGDYVITVSAIESENASYKLQIAIR